MSRHVDDRGVVTTTVVTTHGGSDMRAAFTGLIIGALAILAVVYTIVKLTAASFEGHNAAPGAAAEQHAAPAAPAPATGTPATPPPTTPH